MVYDRPVIGVRAGRWRDAARVLGVVAAALAVTSIIVFCLERLAAVPDASALYIVAVVAVAVREGPAAAVVAALGSFLVYNFLFILPLHTFAVTNPADLIDLLVLLFAGVVAGRLAGQGRDRAEAARTREREARALFRLSRTMALAGTTREALSDVIAGLVSETRFARVWIALANPDGSETTAADSSSDPQPSSQVVAVLQRRPGDEPAEWSLVHYGRGGTRGPGGADVVHRVFIESAGIRLGSVWATRSRRAGSPGREETRLLSAAADQIGQALARDRLAAEAVKVEVARRSDALKSALLDSVSHELRTPLASIRAAAGNLADPAVEWTPDEARQAAETIDQEADRLGRLVANLLDMSRIEAGELRADLRPLSPAEAVGDAVAAQNGVLGTLRVDVDVPSDLPAVLVDELYLGQVIANVLVNIVHHAGPGARATVRARLDGEPPRFRLTISDTGPGVPEDALEHLFDKFYRVDATGQGSRRGSGIGLSISRGLVEAMGGTIGAARAVGGGLAVTIDLPLAGTLPT